jgi:hypothetical protein
VRTIRFFVCLLALAAFAETWAVAQESGPAKKITVIGKFARVMAIGAETLLAGHWS